MEEAQNQAMNFDWGQLLEVIKTQGVDLAMNVAIAIAIFYVGKLVVGLVVRGLRKVMQQQEVDRTLETFVCNLLRMALMVIVIIAAISQVGIETTSFIAIFGAAGLAVVAVLFASAKATLPGPETSCQVVLIVPLGRPSSLAAPLSDAGDQQI